MRILRLSIPHVEDRTSMLTPEDVVRTTPAALVLRATTAGAIPMAALTTLGAAAEHAICSFDQHWAVIPLYLACGGLLGLALSPLLFMLNWRVSKWTKRISWMICISFLVGSFILGTHSPRAVESKVIADATAPDILLVSIDTLRADRWQALAPHKFSKMPRVEFEKVWASSGLTAPAHASLLSGEYPHRHRVLNNGQALPLKKSDGSAMPLLPELLQENGWTTLGVNSVIHLDSSFGFARGFDEFSGTEVGLPGWLRKYRQWLLPKLLLRSFGAGRTVRSDGESALAARELWSSVGTNAPRFMWLHMFGPHWPYSAFGPQPIGTDWPLEERPGFAAETVSKWQISYDRGVLNTAKVLADLLESLRDRESERPLWVVITGDHGEYLGEHGASDHGDLMYDSGLRVPLWVLGPNLTSATNQVSISHVDMLPSICEIAGIQLPDNFAGDFSGRSWAPTLYGQQLTPLPVFSETRHAAFDNAMCVVDDIKLIRNLVVSPEIMTRRGSRSSSQVAENSSWLQAWEAYDLRADPTESQRLPGKPPRMAEQIQNALDKFLQSRGTPPEKHQLPSLAPEVIEALSGLGYH